MGSSKLSVLPPDFVLEDPEQKFNRAADFTFGQEGGAMVDKGRPTNYGIRQDILDHFNQHNNLPLKSVNDLTPDEARSIAKHAYFDTPGFDKLPSDTAAVLFDYGFNSGPKTAVKALQSTVGTTPDGIMGPKTLKATDDFIRQNGEKALLQKIVDQRKRNYDRLLRDPSNRQWRNGWMNRIKNIKNRFGLALDSITGVGTAEAADLPSDSSFEELPQGFQLEKAPGSSPSPAQAGVATPSAPGLPDLKNILFEPPLPEGVALPDGFRLEDQLKQGKAPSLLDKVQAVFSKPPEQRQAEAANIYAISKTTGLDPLFVEKNYDKIKRDPSVTGIKPTQMTNEEFMGMLTLPAVGAGVLTVGPIATAAGMAGFTLLDHVIDIKKFVPENASDEVKTAVDLADFIGKGLIAHGISKASPKFIEAFTKSKIEQYKLPEKVSLSGEQVRDIYHTGKLTTPEQVQLYSALDLTRDQLKRAISKGVDINVPAEKIVTLTDKPWWSKVKGMFGISSEPTTTSSLAGKPTQALPGLPDYSKDLPKDNIVRDASGQPISVNMPEKPTIIKELLNSSTQAPTPTVFEPPKSPLHAEALKYKTPEEFVKGQEIVFHGTNYSSVRGIQKDGLSVDSATSLRDGKKYIYFTKSEKYADAYSAMKGGDLRFILRFKKPPDSIIDKGTLKKGMKKPDLISSKDIPAEDIQIKGKDGNWYPIKEFNLFMGEPDTFIGKNKSIEQTKSQLTAIWNEAHGAGKPAIIKEAEKHGTVIGLDAGTKLPIIDTTKPAVTPTETAGTAAPVPATAPVTKPATPFIERRKGDMIPPPKTVKGRLSDWTPIIDTYDTPEGKKYQIDRLNVPDSIKGRLYQHYGLFDVAPKTEVPNGQNVIGGRGTVSSPESEVIPQGGQGSGGPGGVNRPEEVGKVQVSEVGGGGAKPTLETSGSAKPSVNDGGKIKEISFNDKLPTDAMAIFNRTARGVLGYEIPEKFWEDMTAGKLAQGLEKLGLGEEIFKESNAALYRAGYRKIGNLNITEQGMIPEGINGKKEAIPISKGSKATKGAAGQGTVEAVGTSEGGTNVEAPNSKDIAVKKVLNKIAQNNFGKDFSALSDAERRKIYLGSVNTPKEIAGNEDLAVRIPEDEALKISIKHGIIDDMQRAPSLLQPKSGFVTDGKYAIIDKPIAEALKRTFWEKENDREAKKLVKDKGFSLADAQKIIKKDFSEKFHGFKAPDIMKALKDQGMDKADIPLSFVGISRSHTGKKSLTMYFTDGKEEYALDGGYVKLLKDTLPGSKMYGTGDNQKGVFFKLGEKVQGVVLPVKTNKRVFETSPKEAVKAAVNESGPDIGNKENDYYKKINSRLSDESGQVNLPGVDELAAISKELINYIAPRKFVPRESLDTVMTELGKRNKLEFELETSLAKITKFFDNQSNQDNVAFIDRIKTGQKQSTPELQRIADMMRDIEDIMHAEAREFNPSLSYKENHYRVLWKVIPGSKEAEIIAGFKGIFRKPFEGSKGFAKQSTLSDMSEGLQRGGVPYSYNPSVMWQAGLVDMQKFITANRMFDTLKNIKYVKFVRLGETPPTGFRKLDDRISNIYFPTTPGMVHAGSYYVEENTARILNNFLSRDLVRESHLGRGLLALKNVTTSIELSLSPFHAAYTSLTSVASEIGTGLQKMYNIGLLQGNSKEFLKGLSDIALSVRSPYYLTRIGTNIIQMVRDKDFLKTPAGKSFINEFPDAKQLLDDLFTGGGKLAMHQDYKINSLRAFKEGIKNKDGWAVTLSAIPAANEVIMKPLFEQFIPRLKIGNFLREYSAELVARKDQLDSGKLTRPQLARQVWDSVENRFGEMNFDNLFWNRTFKSAMQLVFRSVTWKIGALKNIGQGTMGQIGEIIDGIQSNKAPKLNRNTAYLLGIAALIVATAEIIQRSNGQGSPKNFKDIIAPRYDEEGNRISLNTHMKDWIHIIHSPAGFAKNSLTGAIGKEIDIWDNKDFYGTNIYNEDDPIWRKELDKFHHRFPTPFSVTSMQRLNQLDAPAALKFTTSTGFTQPSPSYITNTPAEQLASDIIKERLPVGGRTKESANAAQTRFKLMEDYSKSGNLDNINEALRNGTINKRQMNDIIKKSKQSPLERMTSHMSYDDVSRIIEVANPDEINTLVPIFTDKINRKIKASSLQDRADLEKIKYELLNKYK